MARRHFLVRSGLCVGAMIPDLPYFLPGRLGASLAHEPLGLVTLDLAFGLLLLAIWLRWLREPTMTLAPAVLRRRLEGRVEYPLRAWLAACGAIVVGAATHLLWDQFTHPWGLFVRAIPPLQDLVFEVQGYAFFGYRLAQQLSSVLGLFVLIVALHRWVRRTPPSAAPLPTPTAARIGVASAAALGMVSMFIGEGVESDGLAEGLRSVAWRCAIGGALGLAAGLVGHALVWHWRRPGRTR